MTTYERQQSLLDILRKQLGLCVSEIAKALGVSKGTIRNALNALEEEGRLKGVHGESISIVQSQFQNKTFIKI